MNILKNNLAFSLIEVLLMVTLFAIVLSSAISIVGTKTSREDINAKARQVVDFVSRAHDYSVSGFQQDVWGIKILDNDALCEDNGDCLVLFKGRDWNSRNASYDRFLNFNTGVYIDADQENEFYFEYMSGWLSTNYDQAITLKHPGIDENKIIIVENSGLTYIQGQLQYGQSLAQSTALDFSEGTFTDVEQDGDYLTLSSIASIGYTRTPVDIAYDSYTNSMWVLNLDESVSQLNFNGREIAHYSFASGSLDVGSYNTIVFDSYTNSIWFTVNNNPSGVAIQMDVTDGTILNTVTLDYQPYELAFDSYTNSIWVDRFDGSSPSLFQINVETATTTAHAVTYGGYQEDSILFDPENNSVWVSNYAELNEYDVTDGSLLNTYNLTSEGACAISDMLYESYTGSIWAADNCNEAVFKIDNSDGSVIASTSPATGSNNLYSIVYDSNSNSIWAGTEYILDSELKKLNINTLAIEETLSLDFDTFSIMSYVPDTDDIVAVSYFSGATVVDVSTSDYYANYSTYALCDQPKDVIFDSSTNSIWVSCAGTIDAVLKVDVESGTVLSTTTAASISNPDKLAFDSTQNIIYAAAGLYINRIDASDGSFLGYVNSGGAAGVYDDILYDNYTNSIWASDITYDVVDKYDATDGSYITSYNVGQGPSELTFDSLTNSIWVANKDDKTFTKLNPSDGSFIASSTITHPDVGPDQILFDPSNNTINVGRTRFDQFNASDASHVNNFVVSEISSAGDTAYDPISQTIWVTDEGSEGIHKIDTDDYSILATYGLDLSEGIAYDSYTQSMWVTHPLKDYISKIPVRVYDSAGIYVSGILDTYSNTEFGTINWSVESLAGTTFTMKVRTATSSDMTGATDWASCTLVSNGQDISTNNCVNDGDRYIQYRGEFGTTNDGISPRLSSVEILFNND